MNAYVLQCRDIVLFIFYSRSFVVCCRFLFLLWFAMVCGLGLFVCVVVVFCCVLFGVACLRCLVVIGYVVLCVLALFVIVFVFRVFAFLRVSCFVYCN